MKLYHGSRNVEALLRDGFQLTERPGQADFGDFGRGVYLTGLKHRAASYGDVVSVEINPREQEWYYEDSMEAAYDLVETVCGGPTCRGTPDERRARSERFTQFMHQQLGYKGIIIFHEGCVYEVVVFDLSLLKSPIPTREV